MSLPALPRGPASEVLTDWDVAPLERLRAVARRQAWWVLGCTLAGGALAGWTAWRMPSIYEAHATLRLQTEAPSGREALLPLDVPQSIETEMEILRSFGVASEVVRDLGLHPAPGSPAGVARGRADTTGAMADLVRGGLVVTRPQPTAGIVQVAWASADPVLARDVVDGVTRAYLTRRNQMQKEKARTEVAFLRDQVDEAGVQLQAAEDALERFREQRRMFDPATQVTDAARRYGDLRATREETERARQALADVLARAAAQGAGAPTWTLLAATPAAASNPTIAGLLTQLTTLEGEATRLSAWRTAADPDVRAVAQTRDSLVARLGAVAREELALLTRRSAAQDSAIAGLGATLAAVPSTDLEFSRLRRQVELRASMYTLLQTRLKEANITEAVEAANIQLVDAAQVPRVPVRPRRRMLLAFGLVAGLMLGGVIGLGRELTDGRVRSRDDVVRLTALPVLATIPAQRPARLRRPAAPAPRIAARHDGRSSTAEAFRALRSSVTYARARAAREARTLVLTSAEPQDGKSTTAVNLAMVLAEQGLRVALVDADLRRPSLHAVLAVPRAPGLADLLAGGATLADARRAIDLAPHATGTLDFIACGHAVPNPAERVGSPAMRTLLGELAAAYDAVLVDTPPLAQVTDAAALATLADGVLLVARKDRTHAGAIRQAADELRAVGAPLLGTVLIDPRPDRDRYGMRYGGYYGEAAEGSRAG